MKSLSYQKRSFNTKLILSPRSGLPKVEDPLIGQSLENTCNDIERYIKKRKIKWEELLFEKFYAMRMIQTRKFINLIQTNSLQWQTFLDYLKSIATEDKSTCVSQIHSFASLTSL